MNRRTTLLFPENYIIFNSNFGLFESGLESFSTATMFPRKWWNYMSFNWSNKCYFTLLTWHAYQAYWVSPPCPYLYRFPMFFSTTHVISYPEAGLMLPAYFCIIRWPCFLCSVVSPAKCLCKPAIHYSQQQDTRNVQISRLSIVSVEVQVICPFSHFLWPAIRHNAASWFIQPQ